MRLGFGVKVEKQREGSTVRVQEPVNSWLWSTVIIGEGWSHWLDCPPPAGALIQARRQEWDQWPVIVPAEVSPYANINGLWWRLTGIGREQLETTVRIRC